jgi:hypothetical protein
LTKFKNYGILFTENESEENKMKKNKIDKRIFKKSPEELQQYIHFKKRGFAIDNKKGKGSYTRKTKHKKGFDKNDY